MRAITGTGAARSVRSIASASPRSVTAKEGSSAVGGGAMPTAELPSFAVTLRGKPADEIDRALRAAAVPVVGRIEDGRVWLDVRTVADDELADVAAAVVL